MAETTKREVQPELPKGPKWLEEVKAEAVYNQERRMREAEEERKHREALEAKRAK